MLMLNIVRVLSIGSVVGLSACSAPIEQAADTPSRKPVRVTNNGQPFQMWEGSLARKMADAACGGAVRTSIYDRYDRATGAWVYPGGCA